MLYLLDTNHCSYIMNGINKNPQYRKPHETKTLAKFHSATSDILYMCEVSISEIIYGAETAPNVTSIYQRFNQLKTLLPCLTVTSDCWELHGKTKGEMANSGKKMEDFDLMIACIAKKYGCIVVTNDGNFSNLPSGFVNVENWAV